MSKRRVKAAALVALLLQLMALTIKSATAAVGIAAKGVSNAYDKFGSVRCQSYVEVVTIVCAAEGELQTADTAKMCLVPVESWGLCTSR